MKFIRIRSITESVCKILNFTADPLFHIAQHQTPAQHHLENTALECSTIKRSSPAESNRVRLAAEPELYLTCLDSILAL
jgi:hypothetical protein